MCAALWTRQLQHGLPGGPPPGPPTSPSGPANPLTYARHPPPVGPVPLPPPAAGTSAAGSRGAESSFRARASRGVSAGPPPASGAADPDAILAAAVEQLGEYFSGQRQVFALPLDLAAASAFDRRVLDLIAAIPYGQTRTYGELA